MTKQQSKDMKRKLLSKTTRWEYSDKTVIHTISHPKEQLIYFSGASDVQSWNDGGGYIDLAPKGNFITRFVKRLWNMRKLEKLLNK